MSLCLLQLIICHTFSCLFVVLPLWTFLSLSSSLLFFHLFPSASWSPQRRQGPSPQPLLCLPLWPDASPLIPLQLLALSDRTNLGSLGSPARVPFALSAEFNLLSSNPLALSLLFNPPTPTDLSNGDDHKGHKAFSFSGNGFAANVAVMGRSGGGVGHCCSGCASPPRASCRSGTRQACGSTRGCACQRGLATQGRRGGAASTGEEGGGGRHG